MAMPSDCKHRLASNRHGHRSTAHHLAHEGLCNTFTCMWAENVPVVQRKKKRKKGKRHGPNDLIRWRYPSVQYTRAGMCTEALYSANKCGVMMLIKAQVKNTCRWAARGAARRFPRSRRHGSAAPQRPLGPQPTPGSSCGGWRSRACSARPTTGKPQKRNNPKKTKGLGRHAGILRASYKVLL